MNLEEKKLAVKKLKALQKANEELNRAIDRIDKIDDFNDMKVAEHILDLKIGLRQLSIDNIKVRTEICVEARD